MTIDSNPKPDTRQARRAARRRTEILEAAGRVFAEKGFHRTTTKDIAEEADVAEGTIYNYFESKGDLLINLIKELAELEKRRTKYAELLDEDARQSFRDLVAERFAVFTDRQTLLMAVLPEIIVSHDLRELYQQRVMVPGLRDLEDHIRARVERGQIESIDVSLVTRLLAALGMGLEILTVLGDTEIQALWDDIDRMADVLTRAAFDGMLSIPDQYTQPDDTPAHGE